MEPSKKRLCCSPLVTEVEARLKHVGAAAATGSDVSHMSKQQQQPEEPEASWGNVLEKTNGTAGAQPSDVSPSRAGETLPPFDGDKGSINLGVFFRDVEGDLALESVLMNRQPKLSKGNSIRVQGDTFACSPRREAAVTADNASGPTTPNLATAAGTTAANAEAPDAAATAAAEAEHAGVCAAANPCGVSPDGSRSGTHNGESVEVQSKGLCSTECGALAAAAERAADVREERLFFPGDSGDSDTASDVAPSSTASASGRGIAGSSVPDVGSSSSDLEEAAAVIAVRSSVREASSRNGGNNDRTGAVEAVVEKEVINLTDEEIDNEESSDVRVVNVNREPEFFESAPTGDNNLNMLPGERRPRPLARSRAAVVLDSDDDEVVELRPRHRFSYSPEEHRAYALRQLGYSNAVARAMSGRAISAHLRHRLLQDDMARREPEEEANSNPALPRCPICLKRYRQQQQLEDAAERQGDDKEVGTEDKEQTAGEPQTDVPPPTSSTIAQNSVGLPHLPPQPNAAGSDDDHVVALKCGHVFCEGCIRAALRTRRQCPVCRVALRGPRPYQRIFL